MAGGLCWRRDACRHSVEKEKVLTAPRSGLEVSHMGRKESNVARITNSNSDASVFDHPARSLLGAIA
jgi:hypothetical protein